MAHFSVVKILREDPFSYWVTHSLTKLGEHITFTNNSLIDTVLHHSAYKKIVWFHRMVEDYLKPLSHYPTSTRKAHRQCQCSIMSPFSYSLPTFSFSLPTSSWSIPNLYSVSFSHQKRCVSLFAALFTAVLEVSRFKIVHCRHCWS